MQFLRALTIHIVVFFIAISAVWAGGDGGEFLNNGLETGLTIFASCALIAFIVQWIALIPAYLLKTEHFYDLTGGATYLAVIIFAFMQSEQYDLRSVILTLLVSIWAIRLSGFLFLRVRKQGSDSRFDVIKLNFWRFSIAWTVQGLWVLITSGAAIAAITSNHKIDFGWVGALGLLLWLIGFLMEAVADNQKRIFKQQKNTHKEFIQTGLWARSRHPNYFGEILLWVGVAIIAYPALYQWQIVTLISPLFVILLLTKISGISLQEQQADERWADNSDYQAYKKRTPVLIPKLAVKS
jgi:steroid 5-alpha reductase family enzyme